jgi:iron complex transport system ATP-binding protein
MTPQLDIRDISFSYGEQDVFRDLNLEVFRGDVICVLGANGCGKTTLFRCINGALKPKTGTILLDNKSISAMGVIDLAKQIGTVFQEHSAPFPFSVLEVVRMGRAPHLGFFATPSGKDDDIAEKALDQVGMYHLKDKPYTRISGGERQLVLIARTLAQKPKIVMLDEPTSHLDFRNQVLILKMINQLSAQGFTIIMSTHLPNQAFLISSKVALMSEGKFIASGRCDDIVTEKNLEETYGVALRIVNIEKDDRNPAMKVCIPVMEGS